MKKSNDNNALARSQRELFVGIRDFKKLHKLPFKRSLDKSSINNYIL